MRDLTRALEGLCDDLAETHREISVLEQIGRELTTLADRFGGGSADSMIRLHLEEIARRSATALARQASIARMLKECGRERCAARCFQALPARRPMRSKSLFPRSIAG